MIMIISLAKSTTPDVQASSRLVTYTPPPPAPPPAPARAWASRRSCTCRGAAASLCNITKSINFIQHQQENNITPWISHRPILSTRIQYLTRSPLFWPFAARFDTSLRRTYRMMLQRTTRCVSLQALCRTAGYRIAGEGAPSIGQLGTGEQERALPL